MTLDRHGYPTDMTTLIGITLTLLALPAGALAELHQKRSRQ